MKKVLFASTALVLSAGVAAAEVRISGTANVGLKYDGSKATDELTVHNEIDFDVVGTGETDGGISFGASIDLDNSSDDSANASTTDDNGDVAGGTTISDPEVFLSYNSLRVSVGDIGEANDRGGLSDVGYDGIGIDDVAEVNSYGSHDVRVDYAFGSVAVAASIDSSNDDWALGLSTSFDAISLDVGVGETGVNSQANITVGYSAAAFSGAIFYADSDTNEGYGAQVSYTTGDVTVTAVYADNDNAADAAFGIGVAYDLGGATLAGGIGDNGTDTVADLGISFSF